MRISRPLAIVLDLCTIWPLVYLMLFMAFFVVMIFSITATAQHSGPSQFGFFPYIFIPHLATMLLIFALLAFYIIHLFHNAALKDDRRVLWAVVLFMGFPLAAPVYWWLYIWQPARDEE